MRTSESPRPEGLLRPDHPLESSISYRYSRYRPNAQLGPGAAENPRRGERFAAPPRRDAPPVNATSSSYSRNLTSGIRRIAAITQTPLAVAGITGTAAAKPARSADRPAPFSGCATRISSPHGQIGRFRPAPLSHNVFRLSRQHPFGSRTRMPCIPTELRYRLPGVHVRIRAGQEYASWMREQGSTPPTYRVRRVRGGVRSPKHVESGLLSHRPQGCARHDVRRLSGAEFIWRARGLLIDEHRNPARVAVVVVFGWFVVAEGG